MRFTRSPDSRSCVCVCLLFFNFRTIRGRLRPNKPIGFGTITFALVRQSRNTYPVCFFFFFLVLFLKTERSQRHTDLGLLTNVCSSGMFFRFVAWKIFFLQYNIVISQRKCTLMIQMHRKCYYSNLFETILLCLVLIVATFSCTHMESKLKQM